MLSCRTDLAEESLANFAASDCHKTISDDGKIKITRRKILQNSDVPNSVHYTTLELSKEDLQNGRLHPSICHLTDEIERMIDHFDISIQSALIVGLGNRNIPPDALGPLVVDRVPITRNDTDAPLHISALAPGTVGQTGIHCSELLQSWIRSDRPDLLILIDALAAKSVLRLNATVQITDSGIAPGSGVGKYLREISSKTMGVPLICIGVPTVVDGATIVSDALEQNEISPTDKNRNFLKDLESFFVTPTDCDYMVRLFANLIAHAVTEALQRLSE